MLVNEVVGRRGGQAGAVGGGSRGVCGNGCLRKVKDAELGGIGRRALTLSFFM